jgi:uncharacterized membrane protein
MAYCFQNPLISVLPRIVIGFVVFFVFQLFQKIFFKSEKKFVNTTLPSVLATIAGVITNTVLVLGAIIIGFGGDPAQNGQTISQFIFGTILAINFPVEIAACTLIVPPVFMALKRFRKNDIRVGKQNEIKEDASNDTGA